jgi:hypothetical protein
MATCGWMLLTSKMDRSFRPPKGINGVAFRLRLPAESASILYRERWISPEFLKGGRIQKAVSMKISVALRFGKEIR